MTFENPTAKNPISPELITLLDSLKREIKKDINCVRIGVIQSFDAVHQEVKVQIAQQQVASIALDGTKTIVEYPVLLRVPVQFPAGGGYTLTFPIAEGDECIILFNDRELDNWLIDGPGLAPTTGRVHDLSDGIAIVGIRSNPRALGNVSTTTTQLRSDSGTQYVEVGAGVVNIVATTSINLTAPEVNINASTQATITSPITNMTGVITAENTGGATDPFVVNGSMVVTGDVVADGISLVHHIHHAPGGDTSEPV